MLALMPRIQSSARRYPLLLVGAGVLLYSAGPVMLQASGLSGPVFSFWRLWFGVVVLGVATGVQRLTGVAWPTREQWRWAAMAGVGALVVSPPPPRTSGDRMVTTWSSSTRPT